MQKIEVKLEIPNVEQNFVENNIELLVAQFSNIEDPRRNQGLLHPLPTILGIYFCSLLAGRDGWDEAEDFGLMRKDWLATVFDMPNGVPSNHTFSRVIQRISPKMLQEVFRNWLSAININEPSPDTYNVDGKRLRSSHEYSTGKTATHVVNIWAGDQNLIISQEKVAEGTNEITTMKSVLSNIDLEGITVTADAIATQTEIASIIHSRGGDYIMCVKGNQPKLFNELQQFFATQSTCNMSSANILEKGHGRIEKRSYVASSDVQKIFGFENWVDMKAIVKLESSRTIIANGKTSSETRFFISSHKADASLLSKKIRGHWQIENGLHWMLDVAMGEDDCRIRKNYAPENISWMRAVALSLLKKEPSKLSIRRKMTKAGDSLDYLKKVLLQEVVW